MADAPYHHGDLRAALLHEAGRQLDESGPERVSLREAARRVGVSHAAPGKHFASRDHLLAALAVDGFEMAYAAMKAAAEEASSPTERLHAVATAFVAFGTTHANLYRLMAGSSCIALPEVAHSTARHDSFDLFVACIASLGVGDADAWPIKARAFWSLLHGFVMLEIDSRQTGAPSAIHDLRAALDCLVHGLLSQAAPVAV